MLVRAVKHDDIEALLSLAAQAGFGMTSLPNDAGVMEVKIAHSVASFAGSPEAAGREGFLFVLEDENGDLLGTTGVKAHIGVTEPFYSYKISTIAQQSLPLDIYSSHQVLHMVNDFTGVSEVGALFLTKEARGCGMGRFLSRCRFMMLAQFPEIFDSVVIAEMRGVHDKSGGSPFYKNLAQPFFGMPFATADKISATTGSQFIADLMPKYPIYVDLLPKAARNVIGKVLPASAPAKAMLEEEGFRFSGYIDVFDAGPTMKAWRDQIKTVRESKVTEVAAIEPINTSNPKQMICSHALTDFAIFLDHIEVMDNAVIIGHKTAEALSLQKGDKIRVSA
jgi:arginine N-succinyltransferase